MKPIVIDVNKFIFKIKNFKITKFLKDEWIYFLAVCNNFFKEKGFLKYFAFVYFVYFIGYFGLLRNNIDYIDDIARGSSGYFGFTYLSRYMSEYFSKLIHLNLHTNTDISPITQLIAIAFLSIGSMLLVKMIRKKQSYFALFASISLGLSPFFLSNMSFKFDSPFMAIALISPIIPFLFLKKKFIFFILSILTISLMLTTYQASNAIYITMALFTILIYLLKNMAVKNILKNILLFIVSYSVPILIYKFVIMHSADIGYVSTEISYDIKNIITNIYKTLNEYVYIVTNTSFLIYIVSAIILLFIITAISISKNKNILSFLYSILFIIISISFSQGIYLLLINFSTGPRYLNNIGLIFAIICVFITLHKYKIMKLFYIIVICLNSHLLIIQSNSYANALKSEDEYAKYRLESIMMNVNNMTTDKFKIHIFSPSIKNSSKLINSSKNFPIIKKLVTNYYNDQWINYYFFHNNNYVHLYSTKLCFDNKNIILSKKDTYEYKIIKYDNNCFIVEFK